MSPVVVRAAAKVNLHLGVGRVRDDGFHPLTTVYQAVGLCDDVTASTDDEWRLDLSLPEWVEPGSVPTDGSNLVDRAAALLAAHHDVPQRGRVHVEKAIPVAGGLAGGSADAAATLVAFDRLWDLDTSDDDLLRLAAELGSDVPFALLGGTALGTGRGELVDSVTDVGTWWWVLVPDAVGLSTPEVYAHFDRLFPDASETPPDADAVLSALRTGQPVSLARALYNDLQGPAIDLRPELGHLIDAGEAAGALRGVVSGSGPTCAFLCESADHAREVAGALQQDDRRVLVAPAPVAGAHVVHAHG